MNAYPETYTSVFNFMTFGFSVIAAALAIDMYALLRTGQFGHTWRILIVASVFFVLSQVLEMSAFMLDSLASWHLSKVAELTFAITLAYAFYLQRRLYSCKTHRPLSKNTPEDADDNESSLEEFSDESV